LIEISRGKGMRPWKVWRGDARKKRRGARRHRRRKASRGKCDPLVLLLLGAIVDLNQSKCDREREREREKGFIDWFCNNASLQWV